MSQLRNRPSPAQALRQLTAGVRADRADYVRLRDLLESQFEAALHHDTGRLVGLADEIVGLCSTLDGRRLERNELLGIFAQALGDTPREAVVATLLAHLPAPHRQSAEADWAALGEQVRECKALNGRNCQLLMDQHDIMQRVLHSGAEIYAPA